MQSGPIWMCLSASVMFLMYLPAVLAAFAKSEATRTKHLTAFLGAFATFIVSEGLKMSVFGSSRPWMRRPAAAYNCNGLCNDGPQGGRPGFPSTHSAITTFLAASYWRENPALIGTGWAAILYSRIALQCHTWLQVAAGTTLGAAIYLLTRQ